MMSLRKAMFWKRPHAAAHPSLSHRVEPVADVDDNGHRLSPSGSATVIPLRPGTSAFDAPSTQDFSDAAPQPGARITGLMNAPELEAFFAVNQFGFGRHHGSHYRTLEAMERGLDALVAQFQNIVAEMAERRQAKADKLQITRHDIATLSDPMAARLELACTQLQREIAVLREQFALAEQRRGWVLDALNRYRLGFDRGVREALDFDLLNA